MNEAEGPSVPPLGTLSQPPVAAAENVVGQAVPFWTVKDDVPPGAMFRTSVLAESTGTH